MPRKPTASPKALGRDPSSKHPPARRAKPADAAAPVAMAPDSEATLQAMLQAPASLAAMWSQFAQQLQRASEQTWQGLRHDAEVEAEEVQRADSPQQLVGLPIGVAAEQAARWAQFSTQVTSGLLDVQAAWLKEVEAAATRWMSPLFARDGRIAPLGSAQDIVEPPGPDGPLQVWWSAQRMWSESAKVWLHAMSHDLQDEPARR